MEVTANRKIKENGWYKGFVHEPDWKNQRIKTNAQVKDTLKLIQKVIRGTTDHTSELAPRLQGKTLGKTCRNVWRFIYEHIRYKKDKPGVEQVRSPARCLHERVGDCDCMATLAGSILSNLRIPFKLRVTKYKGRRHYQHIYVIVPNDSGGHYTIDPVVEWYNYEEPYSAKTDIPMELEYLHGVDHSHDEEEDSTIVYTDEFEDEDDELGFRRRRKIKDLKKRPRKNPKGKKRPFKKILHSVNKFNPATVALRGGILAAAKLGVPKGMWEKLLWALVSDNEARQRGVNMANHAKVKGVFERVKRIFHGAGGKPRNLVKAMTQGRVNRRLRIVKSTGHLRGFEDQPEPKEGDTLLEVLGPEVYQEEIANPQMHLSGVSTPMGAIATGGALAIAMAALKAIDSVLKKIGEVKAANQGTPEAPADQGMNPITPSLIDPNSGLPVRTPMELTPMPETETDPVTIADENGNDGQQEQGQKQAEKQDSNKDKEDEKKGIWRKENIPYFAVGGIGLAALGVWGVSHIAKKKKAKEAEEKAEKQKSRKAGKPALAGPGGKSRKRTRPKRTRPKTSRKTKTNRTKRKSRRTKKKIVNL